MGALFTKWGDCTCHWTDQAQAISPLKISTRLGIPMNYEKRMASADMGWITEVTH